MAINVFTVNSPHGVRTVTRVGNEWRAHCDPCGACVAQGSGKASVAGAAAMYSSRHAERHRVASR